MGNTLGHLVVMMTHRSLSVLTDGELLDLFAATNDGAAFAALVERHGAMVLGVCRRALSNRHDAEDACQATFLVLARKAGSLRRKDSLSCWLHGVASRVSVNARRDAALRKRREAGINPPSQRCPAEEATWREVRAALDEELGRLPEKYRAPLVLCYLECLTRDEAATRLGVSPGTLHGRLERGRTLLKGRLSKRGLTPSAVVLATLEASAMPPSLAVSTANAAALFASGQPLSVGANVLALTREILMGMTVSKFKVAAVLGVALLVMGGSLIPMGTAQDAKQARTVAAGPGSIEPHFG
jgi:RNA polymerase sigma factor (sigma-70 family)